ncbi:MAG: ester cyclase [Cyanobacteria bacterium P01_G01_bin.39]
MNAQEVVDTIDQSESIGRQIYKGFNERNLDLWDEVIAPDVEVRSTVGTMPMIGREALKNWAAQFQSGFKPRLDLVDEIYGVNRATIAVNLNWKHDQEFFGLEPTGRIGTSIEYFIFWIINGQITRFWVADHTMDLTMYLTRERGMHYPQNFVPELIIQGFEANKFD